MKGDSGKAPSIQWYYKDWLSDRQLQRANSSSRGIWMNILMHMVDCSTDQTNCKEGILEDVTIQELMQLGSCTENEAWDFIDDALKHQFCRIELDKNRTFHIMSRRLTRDSEKRKYWREKKRLQRKDNYGKFDSPKDVPTMSPRTPTPTPTSNNNIYSTSFLAFWSAYPKKVGKGAAFRSWQKAKGKPPISELVAIVLSHKKTEQWKKDNGQYIPNPSTWLNQRRWEDEIETQKQDYVDPEKEELERWRRQNIR